MTEFDSRALLIDPRRWVEPASDGYGYTFTDPINSQPLDPDKIPAWLMAEPTLAYGIGELIARGSDVSVDVLYHRHQEVDDLGEVDGWFERRIARADYHAREGMNIAHAFRQEDIEVVREITSSGILLSDINTQEKLEKVGEAFGIPALDLRHMRADIVGDTKTIYADINSDRTETEKAVSNAKQIIKLGPLMDGYEPGNRAAQWIALQNAREWIGLAEMGVDLSLIEAQHKSSKPLDVVMTYGAWHRDFDRKLRMLGAHVTSVALMPERCADYIDMGAMMRNGRVTPADEIMLNVLLFDSDDEISRLGN